MKTKEELNAIKKEYQDLKDKLGELTAKEMEQVAGGGNPAEQKAKDSDIAM